MRRLLHILFGQKRSIPVSPRKPPSAEADKKAVPAPPQKLSSADADRICTLGGRQGYAGEALTFVRNGRSVNEFLAFLKFERSLKRRNRYTVGPYA